MVRLYHVHTMYPGLNNAAFTLAMCEAPHSVHSSHCIFYFFPGVEGRANLVMTL